MIIYELRQSAYEKAFDLIEEAKKSNKKTKLALCELYDCLSDCYESETDEYPEDEYEDESHEGEYDEETVSYRKHRGMRHYEVDAYDHEPMYKSMRGGMRRHMRRSRSGRYTY